MPRIHSEKAWTIAEVLVAAAVGGILLMTLGALDWQSRMLLRSQKQTAAATTVVQARLEQAAALSWANVTNASALRSMLQDATKKPAGLAILALSNETLTVAVAQPAGIPTPSPSPNPSSISVARANSGTVSGDSTALPANVTAVRVTATVNFTAGTRARQRSLSRIITSEGVGK